MKNKFADFLKKYLERIVLIVVIGLNLIGGIYHQTKKTIPVGDIGPSPYDKHIQSQEDKR